MLSRRFILVIFILLINIWACKKDDGVEPVEAANPFTLPIGFPAIAYPDDNEFTTERWELGKKLFYDNILSVDRTLSCASCHKAALAFSDDVALSDGVMQRPGKRNAPTLANVAYHPYYTREGGVPTLEMQVLVPLQEHNEFDFNIVTAGERLQEDSTYVAMSLKAYGRRPDYYVITRALANFERTLISGNSPYDKHTAQGQSNALSADEKAGMNLFFSDRTNCSKCHSGFNFTNYAFENNGLYSNYADEGRKRLTGEPEDEGRFKVPTLRNIELTSPYMHDGSILTLKEVIDHYNRGGYTHQNKSELIKPLGLSELEKEQLIAFLKSLTDTEFINQKEFKE